MNNLYEIVNKVLSHKEEIIINDCDDPKDAITKIICTRPELLYYIKGAMYYEEELVVCSTLRSSPVGRKPGGPCGR